jgi:hypothetical protein
MEAYPEIDKWLVENAPPRVIEGISFVINRYVVQVKLLGDIAKTQEDFMIASTEHSKAIIASESDESIEKKQKMMYKLLQRITFLADQYEAFNKESEPERKKKR